MAEWDPLTMEPGYDPQSIADRRQDRNGWPQYDVESDYAALNGRRFDEPDMEVADREHGTRRGPWQ